MPWFNACKICGNEFEVFFKTTHICLICAKKLNNAPKFKYVYEDGKLKLKVKKE